MLSCYMDESTAFGEADPSTCVVGYIATGKQWAIFCQAWNLMMKYFGVEILHTRDLETEAGRKGTVYESWSAEKRKEFQGEIQGIIVGSGIKDVGMAIPLSVYKSVMTPERVRTFGETPDRLCALLCMMSAGGYAWAHRGVYKQAPSFVFEAGGTYAPMIKGVHHYLTTESYYQDFYQLSTLRFLPKCKEYPQLQAADYLAFNMSKRSSHVVDPNPPQNVALESLADGKKVRQTRYPLLALYSESESNVFHAPSAEILERIRDIRLGRWKNHR